MIRLLLIASLLLPLLGCAGSAKQTPPPARIEPTTRAHVGNYYVGGHVVRLGAKELPAEGITLKRALIEAGCEQVPDVPRRLFLIRRHGQNEDCYDISIETVFITHLGDTPVQPDDQIIVGVHMMTD